MGQRCTRKEKIKFLIIPEFIYEGNYIYGECLNVCKLLRPEAMPGKSHYAEMGCDLIQIILMPVSNKENLATLSRQCI